MEDVHRNNRKETVQTENIKNAPTEKVAPKKSAKQIKKKTFLSLVNWKWVITAFLSSLVISIILSLLSSEVLNAVNITIALLILLMFVFLGIIFDIIGLSVATASEKPFNSMAAQRIKAGKTGLALIRKADQVSSICNDVIGDICGVISGSAAATIAIKIAMTLGGSSTKQIILNLLLCGLVSAITVGGKAIGKAVGLNYSVETVTFVATILSVFSTSNKKNKKSSNKKRKKHLKKKRMKKILLLQKNKFHLTERTQCVQTYFSIHAVLQKAEHTRQSL